MNTQALGIHFGQLSDLSYCDDMDRVQNVLDGTYMVVAMFCEAQGPAGYALLDHDSLVLVFRGSQHLGHWASNLRAELTATSFGRIHLGFYDTARVLIPQVDEVVQRFGNGRSVIATGHSRGGAIATIVSRHLQTTGIECHTVTYGSPLVGDSSFARSYRPKFHLRFENYRDPVPFALKLRGLGYEPVGTRAFLLPTGGVYVETGGISDAMVFGLEKLFLSTEILHALKDPQFLGQLIAANHGMDDYLQKLAG